MSQAAGAPAAEDDSSAFSVFQSRRFACNRCHRQKLRCDRSPIVAGGDVIISLGPCSRCVRAKVHCQTTTQPSLGPSTSAAATGSTYGTSSGGEGANKRKKTNPRETNQAAEESPPSHGILSVSVGTPLLPADSTSSSFQMELGHNSTSDCDSAMVDMDTINFVDQYNFDFLCVAAGADDIHGTDENVLTPSASLDSVISNTTPPPTDGLREFKKGKSSIGIESQPEQGMVEPAYLHSFGVKLAEVYNTGNDHLPSPTSPTPATTSAPIKDLVVPVTATAAITSSYEPAKKVSPVGPVNESHTARSRLLQLHSLLLTELYCITDADLARAFFSSESTSLPPTKEEEEVDAHISETTNVVRRVLWASEYLIELLNDLSRHDGPFKPPGRSPTDEAPDIACVGRPSCSCGTAIATNAHSPSSLPDTSIPPGLNDAGCYSPTGPTAGASSLVKLPVMISILSSYVSLLSVYRTIFTKVYESLESAAYEITALQFAGSSFPQASQSRSLQSPADYKGGASVDLSWWMPCRPGAAVNREQEGLSRREERICGHEVARRGPSSLLALLDPPRMTRQRILGIRLQLEVMTHMLDQIEDAWAGVLGDTWGDPSHHSRPTQVVQDMTTGDNACRHHHRHCCHRTTKQHAHLQDQDLDFAATSRDSQGPSINLKTRATMEVLQSMLAHEGFVSADEKHGIGLGGLMEMLESIRKLLRNTRFT